MDTHGRIFSDFQSYRPENKSISVSFRVEFDFDVHLVIAPQKPNQNVEKHMFKTRTPKKDFHKYLGKVREHLSMIPEHSGNNPRQSPKKSKKVEKSDPGSTQG